MRVDTVSYPSLSSPFPSLRSSNNHLSSTSIVNLLHSALAVSRAVSYFPLPLPERSPTKPRCDSTRRRQNDSCISTGGRNELTIALTIAVGPPRRTPIDRRQTKRTGSEREPSSPRFALPVKLRERGPSPPQPRDAKGEAEFSLLGKNRYRSRGSSSFR